VKLGTLLALVGPLAVGLVSQGDRGEVEVVVGSMAAFDGIAIRAAAMRTLGERYGLSVENLAGLNGLVVSGPYGLVRHPGYSGLLLFFAGAACLSGGVIGLTFVVPLAFGVVARIRYEEPLLVEEFGQAQTEYRQRVRWRLVPFVY
jgi:protein-S-isoprenylcysteine O-methyltransferase Ste14